MRLLPNSGLVTSLWELEDDPVQSKTFNISSQETTSRKANMINGRFNVYLGLLALVVATIAGFALGQSLDPFYKEGYGQITLWCYLTKAAHTHGMPFGLINIVFGLLLGRSEGSASLKRSGAILTALSLLLPVGVALRGLTEDAKFAEGIAMIGGLTFLAACVVMIFIVRKMSNGK
jgi:hypothetical protein